MLTLADGVAGSIARAAALPGLLLFAALSCAVAAAQDTGRDALSDCLAQLEDDGPAAQVGESAGPPGDGPVERLDEENRAGRLGLVQLEKRCPDLKAALEASPYAAWLPEEWWSSRLSVAALEDLREQISREAEASMPASIDTSGVATALASLGEDATSDRVSWWRRFLEWLTGRLQADDETSSNPTWLMRLIEELGQHQAALRIIAYGLVALLVVFAVLVAFNELRAAGVLGPRRKLARLQRTLSDAHMTRELGLRDLDNCEPGERPSLLLSLIVAALAKRRQVRVDSSATHRELLARLVPDSAEQGVQLARLTGCAERVRYAGSMPSGGDIEEAIVAGRRLLDAVARDAVAKPA